MTDDNRQNRPPQNQRPVMLVPKSLIYGVFAIVIGSFALTQFIYNPYTAAARMDGTERGPLEGLPLWFAIFVGIPAAYFAYTKWIAPLFKRR
jgi:hypothetical protein